MEITKICTVEKIEVCVMNYIVHGIELETEKDIKIAIPIRKAYFSKHGIISLFRVYNNEESYYVFTGTHALIESEILEIIGG
ncbi:MAG: hypothetical protein ACRC1T_09770 [Clostridium chrysemydis]|uniref:hypothetical protein n=1 Tax=Clostridium chrysemydis TaxID=2665504 RepID=UPI003F3A01D2